METETEKQSLPPGPEDVSGPDTRAIRELLLISNEYHIYTMETDGDLALTGQGRHFSCPLKITGVSCPEQAVCLLKARRFDLVVIVPDQTDPLALGVKIKAIRPDLPVALLAPGSRSLLPRLRQGAAEGIDWAFIWSGNPNLFLSVIQLAEDHLTVRNDTGPDAARVVVLVEDSPEHATSLLPMVHREVAVQTRTLVETLGSEREKLAAAESRPKVLLATTYDQALDLVTRYRSCLLCVISDTRLPRAKKTDSLAGIRILSELRRQDPNLPLLLMSTETRNQSKAMAIPARFLDKNTPRLNQEIQRFFQHDVGFGDFVFRTRTGEEQGRAWDLNSFEAQLSAIPEPVFLFHARRNHFAIWLAARNETALALAFTAKGIVDFESPEACRDHMVRLVRQRKKGIRHCLGSHFDGSRPEAPVADFSKIGHGSVGGKARGLAFMAHLLSRCPDFPERYPNIRVRIPKILVICTDLFEAFVATHQLARLEGRPVLEVVQGFLEPPLPEELIQKLRAFVGQVKVPLAVRSSSELEDDRFHACDGLYKTYKIPNNHEDPLVRLDHVATAVKLVWASAYYRTAVTHCKTASVRPMKDPMAVMIQELAGREYGEFFYPALSGTAQSVNFYPVSPMGVEDGVVHLALGLGRTVAQGEPSFRFCPRYPSILPRPAGPGTASGQTRFYALRTKGYPNGLKFPVLSNLERRNLADALEESPVKTLASPYGGDENQTQESRGSRVPEGLTFDRVLKYQDPPLPGLINALLTLGKEGMGGPVEIEFAADLPSAPDAPWEFSLLQIRPMAACGGKAKVSGKDLADHSAVCVSSTALGHGVFDTIRDIVYVRPERFSQGNALEMAREISIINAKLAHESRPFLLAGPGQWGAADPWLGIPVQWSDITGARAIVEIRDAASHAGPFQGSQFFHNITAMGIPYITVNPSAPPFGDRFCLDAIKGASMEFQTDLIEHLRLPHPLTIKLDGRGSRCVILGRQAQNNTMAA